MLNHYLSDKQGYKMYLVDALMSMRRDKKCDRTVRTRLAVTLQSTLLPECCWNFTLTIYFCVNTKKL